MEYTVNANSEVVHNDKTYKAGDKVVIKQKAEAETLIKGGVIWNDKLEAERLATVEKAKKEAEKREKAKKAKAKEDA